MQNFRFLFFFSVISFFTGTAFGQESDLLERKNEQLNLETRMKKEAAQYRAAAKLEKDELAETLYTLAIACDEQASLHDKMGDIVGKREPDIMLNYQQQMVVVTEKVRNLKVKAIALGYKEKDKERPQMEVLYITTSTNSSLGTYSVHTIVRTNYLGQAEEPKTLLLDRKTEQKNLGLEKRDEADFYKKAAEREKGDLATTLYALSLACNEEAILRDKIAETVGRRESETMLDQQQQLAAVAEKVKSLKTKALSLGFIEPSDQ